MSVAAPEIQQLSYLVRQKEWEKAAALAQTVLTAHPEDATGNYLHGVIQWQKDEKLRAIQFFRRAEKLGSDAGHLHKALGLAYFELNQFILFEEQMQKAIESSPDDPAPFFHLGRYAQSVLEDCERGLRYFEQSLARQADHLESLYFKGHCLEVLERPIEASESYQTAIETLEKGERIFSWPYLGMARLLLQRQPETAAEWAGRAAAMEPSLSEAHRLLGETYKRLGRLTDAISALKEAARLAPAAAEPRYQLFQLYKELGQQEAAREELAQFQRLKAVYGDR